MGGGNLFIWAVNGCCLLGSVCTGSCPELCSDQDSDVQHRCGNHWANCLPQEEIFEATEASYQPHSTGWSLSQWCVLSRKFQFHIFIVRSIKEAEQHQKVNSYIYICKYSNPCTQTTLWNYMPSTHTNLYNFVESLVLKRYSQACQKMAPFIIKCVEPTSWHGRLIHLQMPAFCTLPGLGPHLFASGLAPC